MNPLLKSLRARHKVLETRIEDERKATKPDPLRLTALKRLKLALKDQIAMLERSEQSGSPAPLIRRRATPFATPKA